MKHKVLGLGAAVLGVALALLWTLSANPGSINQSAESDSAPMTSPLQEVPAGSPDRVKVDELQSKGRPAAGRDADRKLIITMESGLDVEMPVTVEFISDTLAIVEQLMLPVKERASVPIPAGASRAIVTSIGSCRSSVQIGVAGDSQVALRMKALVLCRGKIVSAVDKRPLASAHLAAAPGRGEELRDIMRTGPDGEFSAWLPIETMLTATAEGYCAAPGIVLARRHHGENLVLECAPQDWTAVVRVRNEDGKAIAGAKVIIGERWSNIDYDTVKYEEGWRATAVSGMTNAQGECRLGGDWKSQSTLAVHCKSPGYAWTRVLVPLFDKDKGKRASVDGIDVVLTRGCKLSGKVADTEGHPVAGVRVWLDCGTWAEEWVWTDQGGGFQFDGCDRSFERRLEVNGRGWVRKEMVVEKEHDGEMQLTIKAKR